MFSNRMDVLEIVPTSKLSLKMSCLKACGNDVEKATKLYDYISNGLDLPDMEPIPPTGMSKVMAGVDSLSQWIEGHSSQIEKLITYVQLLKQKQ